MRYTSGLVMLLLAVGVLGWALRHRSRVLALIPQDALARHREKLSEDPKSLSAFGEIMRPIVLFASYGYCITIQTRYRMTAALAARSERAYS